MFELRRPGTEKRVFHCRRCKLKEDKRRAFWGEMPSVDIGDRVRGDMFGNWKNQDLAGVGIFFENESGSEISLESAVGSETDSLRSLWSAENWSPKIRKGGLIEEKKARSVSAKNAETKSVKLGKDVYITTVKSRTSKEFKLRANKNKDMAFPIADMVSLRNMSLAADRGARFMCRSNLRRTARTKVLSGSKRKSLNSVSRFEDRHIGNYAIPARTDISAAINEEGIRRHESDSYYGSVKFTYHYI
ncbi:hypothetical protein Mapa_012279 [Marchantia paleacea]|nr:hypothetical protein Mapa_012279 [Marchantia paleacea]